jgi:uncharacterized membrane protein
LVDNGENGFFKGGKAMDPLTLVNILGTLFFVLWIGIALLNAVNPYFAWRITESWKATKEPTQSYFLLRRIMGLIFTAIGIGFLIWVRTRR